MSLAFDEFGRPFIIIREQEKKKRTKGMEAHKVSPSSKTLRKLVLYYPNKTYLSKLKYWGLNNSGNEWRD